MEWFKPLWTELKNLLVPFCLAAVVTLYGVLTPSPPFVIAGTWALLVTVVLAVFRSLAQEK